MQVSVVNKSDLDRIVFRLDSEYYKPDLLFLENRILSKNHRSIRELGGVLDCSAFYPSITDYYNFEGDGIPFLRVNEVSDGLVKISENTAFLPKSVLQANPTTISHASPGDVIIAKGGNSLAKTGLVTDQYRYYAFCRDLIVLRTNQIKEINHYYIWCFLHSSVGQRLLLRTASQTGQPHLTLEAIYQLNIPLYSNLFHEKFEVIYKEANELSIQSKKLYCEAETILLSEIGLAGWKPQYKLSFIKNYSDTQQAGRIDAEYFQPKYEEIENKIKSYKKGYSLVKNEFKQNKSTLKFDKKKLYSYVEIGSVDISAGEIMPCDVQGADLPANAKRVLKNGDVIISKVRTYRGAIAIVDQDGLVGSGAFTVLSEKGQINKETLFTFLHSKPLLAWSLKPNTGTSYPVIVDNDLLNLPVPLFPKDVQTQIQQKITESFSLRKKSKHLLECAKRAVEIAIEQDENTAMEFIKANVSKN